MRNQSVGWMSMSSVSNPLKVGSKSLLLAGCLMLGMSATFAGCEFLQKQSPDYVADNLPIEVDPSQPEALVSQTPTKDETPLKQVDVALSGAETVITTYAKPIAEVAAPATGGLSTMVVLAVLNLLQLARGVVTEVSNWQRGKAIKAIHNSTLTGVDVSRIGADGLVTDPKAKITIQKVVGT